MHERWLLIHDVAVWVDDSQVVLMTGELLDHLGILVNYLSPSSPAHGLGIILLAKNGRHGVGQSLWARRLRNALLHAHIREVIL